MNGICYCLSAVLYLAFSITEELYLQEPSTTKKLSLNTWTIPGKKKPFSSLCFLPSATTKKENAWSPWTREARWDWSVDPGNEVRFVQYLIPDPLSNWWSLIGHNTLHYIRLFYLKKVVIFGSCVGIICPPLKWKLILSQGADNVWYWPPPPEVRRMDPSKPSYHVASGK